MEVGDSVLPLAAALLVVMTAIPALTTASPAGNSSAYVERVLVSGPEDQLVSLVQNPAFETTFQWMEIGWIGLKASPAAIQVLREDLSLQVEHEGWLEPVEAVCPGPASTPSAVPCPSPSPVAEEAPSPGGDYFLVYALRDLGVPYYTPTDQTPYGIEQLYNDPNLTTASGGHGTVLGHLDTGVDRDHRDLAGPLVYGESNGDNEHGTHTLGTAVADAGSDENGIYGVAPNATARAYDVHGVTSGLEAIRECTQGSDDERLCDVITTSVSLQGGGEEAYRDAIQAFVDAGGLFVAAAGNNGPMATVPAFNNTVAVGAIDENKEVMYWSARGYNDGDCRIEENELDFVAAGSNVESTLPGHRYGTKGGTSMAAPHVAGLALKMWAGNGSATYDRLVESAEDIGRPGCDPASGHGLPHVLPSS